MRICDWITENTGTIDEYIKTNYPHIDPVLINYAMRFDAVLENSNLFNAYYAKSDQTDNINTIIRQSGE